MTPERIAPWALVAAGTLTVSLAGSFGGSAVLHSLQVVAGAVMLALGGFIEGCRRTRRVFMEGIGLTRREER